MNISESNKIFRRAIITGFFEPQLLHLDFKKSPLKHPEISSNGLMKHDSLHLFFDIETGSDYPDGDEWFIIDLLFPYDIKLPDSLIGADYFSTILGDSKFWHHRELVRYKYGKSKKLDASIEFIISKYMELYDLLDVM